MDIMGAQRREPSFRWELWGSKDGFWKGAEGWRALLTIYVKQRTSVQQKQREMRIFALRTIQTRTRGPGRRLALQCAGARCHSPLYDALRGLIYIAQGVKRLTFQFCGPRRWLCNTGYPFLGLSFLIYMQGGLAPLSFLLVRSCPWSSW